jgi:vitamin B12 transporter
MRRTRLRSKTALALLVTLPAFPLAAQVINLPEVVIYANQAPTNAEKVGSAVTVLRGAELIAQGYSTVAEALKIVPGVAVNPVGGRGAFTQVRVRGAEANHTLVMIDGVPVNDITDGDFNFADFSLEDLDRIEVIRGPQSGLYGANAHAGVISFVTKSGRGLKRPEASIRIEGGSRQSRSISATARGAAGAAYGSVSIDYNHTEGHNMAFNGSERDGSRGLSATAKLGADVTPDFNIEGFVRYVSRHTQFDSQPTFGPLEGIAVDQAADVNNFDSMVGRVAGTWKMFGGALVQTLAASRHQQNRDDFDVNFGYFKSDGHRDRIDYKATLTHDTNVIGGERHTFSFATDWQREFLTVDSESFMFDPAAAAFWANGAIRTRKGIAGEYSIDLPTGLTLTGALRHDWNSGFDNSLTWRTTASQRLAHGFRLHASAGTGVTNPTFMEQYGFFVGTFIGNPALKPEHSMGWDTGLEYRSPDGRLVTDVTYFESRYEDKIVLVGFPSTPVNVPGISPRHGVEVSAKYAPLDWLTLEGTYTYTVSRLADGSPEVRRPRHSATASATATFAQGRGRATVNVAYNGAMHDTWFNFALNNPTVVLGAYTVIGGIVSYDLTPMTTVFVRAENLFDEDYSNVFSYRAPGFAAFAGLRVKLGGE